MKKNRVCLLILAVFLLCASTLSACVDGDNGNAENPPAADEITVSDSAFTSFVAQDFDGNIIDETVFAGHAVTMINVWGTYCAPCKDEMPELAELHSEYAEKGFQVIGIPIDGEAQRQKAIDIIGETHADYRHLTPSNSLKSFLANIKSVPYTIFLNDKGEQLGEPYSGAKSKADWKKIIDRMLEFTGK